MKENFINVAFTKAIEDYLSSKDKKEGILYNSFLVVVIRILVLIYGELDIINPYQMYNEETFDNNLLKYGADKKAVDNLKRLLDGFLMIDERNKKSINREENVYFIEIQKLLIDLFLLKKKNYDISSSEVDDFYDLLYTPTTSNPLRLSYNYLNAFNIYEVANYYKEKISTSNLEEETLVENVEIKVTYDDNKEEISELQITPKKELITTGNGYVDILIIMSIIVTIGMAIVIFSTIVF